MAANRVQSPVCLDRYNEPHNTVNGGTMKTLFRRMFWPILNYFETTEPPVNYRHSHRTILHVVGWLFMLLSLGSLAGVIYTGQFGALVPVVVFFCVSLVALVVASLGSDSAVSRIWGNK